jgi:cytochrome c oxidase assembly protein subunit 15
MMNHLTTQGRNFRRWGTATVVAVYVLILVGGIVRATGAGMGCPDWPKCFGQWIPPTELGQLPEDYKDVYAEQRKQKNLRLTKYFRALGFHSLAERLANDPSIYVEQDFNALKTWIEYVNRLIGAVIGLLIFATFLASFTYFKSRPVIFWISLASVLLTGIQGWIGSVVVSTNLLGGMITVHMFLAIVMVLLLIYALYLSYEPFISTQSKAIARPKLLRNLAWVALALTFAQTMLGTQVREALDVVAESLGAARKAEWVEAVGLSFLIHRSFSWLVLGSSLALLYYLRKELQAAPFLKVQGTWLLATTLVQIFSGIVLAYWAMPALLQPLHLVAGIIMLGQQFFIILALQPRTVAAERFTYTT